MIPLACKFHTFGHVFAELKRSYGDNAPGSCVGV